MMNLLRISKHTLQDNIDENGMVVDRKDDNINDIISISKPKGKFVDTYANDNKQKHSSYKQFYLLKASNRFSISYSIEIE